MLDPTATPQLDRIVTLRDGRRMAYAEWGRTDGRPVVLLHGMPGSRLLCPGARATELAGVRLLTVDRPGYGLSSPYPGRTLLGWVSDYVEWAELIGLSPCPIIGWSGGGPYALACAAYRPECVTSVGLAASLAPLDEVPSEWDVLPSEVIDLTKLIRRDAPGAMDAIRARCQWFETGWETMFEVAASGVDESDADNALLSDPNVLEPLLASMREGARQGTAGYVEDWVAVALPWGFASAEVTHEVQVWWGDEDQLVTRDCAEHFAQSIQRSTLTVLAGRGHLFPIQHWQEMLEALH